MADIAAASLAETIISLLEFGWKVIKRVNECRESFEKVPEALEDVSVQLPLLLNALDRSKQKSGTPNFSVDVGKVVLPVINGCTKQIKKLDEILGTLLPKSGDDFFKKTKKAFLGVKNEEKLKEIKVKILEYVQILTLHEVLGPGDRSIRSKRALFDVPFERDENFIGRMTELQELDRVFGQKARASLMGVGGIGKSQIAIEYCYQYHENNPATFIFWVYCSNESRFRQSYKDIARKLDLRGWDDPSQNPLQLVVEWLNSQDSPDWLMVMDNVDNLEIFFPQNNQSQSGHEQESMLPYVPQSKAGRLLFTSRDQRIRSRFRGANAITVEEPSVEEAAKLLTSKLDGEEPNDVHLELVEFLDRLPLAITQAGAFMNETGTSAEEYLPLLKEENNTGIDLLEEDRGDERRDAIDVRHSNSIVGTWKITYNLLVARHPKAAELMSFMAMLDRHTIAKKLLEHQIGSGMELLSSITILQAFSFIKPNQTKTAFGMHRLAQLCTRYWLDQDGSVAIWESKALCTVSQCFPEGVCEQWSICEPMVPHAMIALTYSYNTGVQRESADLLANLGWLDHTQTRYTVAESRLLKAIEIYQTLGEEKQELTTKRKLASTLDELHRYEEAEKLCKEAIEGQQRLLGGRNILTLMSEYLLAKIYCNQGLYQKAETQLLQVIAAKEEAFGSESVPVAYSKEALSRLYKRENRLAEAEAVLNPAMAIMKQQLGKGHPDTLLAFTTSGLILCEQQRWNEAIARTSETFEMTRLTFGDEHPRTLDSAYNLALVHGKAGHYGDVEAIAVPLLERRIRVNGKDAPETLQVMHDVSVAYRLQGKLKDSQKMAEQALLERRKVLGEDHPDTLLTLTGLGAAYQRQGLFEQAERAGLEFLKRGTIVFGEDDPQILMSMEILVSVYQQQGRWKEAGEAGERSVAVRKKFLGNKHPETLFSMSQLRHIYLRLNRPGDAQKLEVYGVIAPDQTSWPYCLVGHETPLDLRVLTQDSLEQ